ncbi:MAG: ATP synthase F1 subunit delta [Chlorobi bacterium]|nr:ATP synthase F1 subunit delta [Chlorobiota bacterium]
MNHSSINTRYAKAFFKLIIEKNSLDQALNDMSDVYSVFNEVESLSAILEDPVLGTFKKINVIQSVFKNKISELSLSFLNLIVKNKRSSHIKDIIRNFLNLVKKHQGIKSIVLTTAHTLEEKQKEKIKVLIKNEVNSKIDLTEVVNSNIIGGFILRIEDLQYDASVKAELQKVKKKLLESPVEK